MNYFKLDKRFTGLSKQEVLLSRKKHGKNELDKHQQNNGWRIVKEIFTEPMVLILVLASFLYFLSKDWSSGLFMIGAIVLITAISLYQDYRSEKALEKLKDLTLPESKVIRNNISSTINSTEIVVDDLVIVDEGGLIPADGVIIQSNDFAVNESILTGESLSINKSESDNNLVYAGSAVSSGLAIIKITKIGNETKIGQIGKLLLDIKEEKTLLETQIEDFVKRMIWIGSSSFILVLIFNFFTSYNIVQSILQSLTLAMSVLPEEIPVAFTTFMVIGSWRLAKMGVVTKRMKTVESLGSATVICTDKTGTLTKNEMTLNKIYNLEDKKITNLKNSLSTTEQKLIKLAMLASEPLPFDPMEISLHNVYSKLNKTDNRKDYKLIHEYPLSGTPPMMTHIWSNKNGYQTIATKGAPEAIMELSDLSLDESKIIKETIKTLANDGYRILAVGQACYNSDKYPTTQQEFAFKFLGLLAFYDPPKENISEVLKNSKKAGVNIKIITGDNQETTTAIAKQIEFDGYEQHISGKELMKLSHQELSEAVQTNQVFTRMFPEAKLKIIEALKDNGEIVAMLGDGVNDSPALKAAHIGVAMGTKGTEMAKQAADLILLDDDLKSMISAMAMGRKIYANLKKAILYIISIHAPIILTVLIPLAFGWIHPTILFPIHVIVLELIMGPTCSIVYENEPIEDHLMSEKPRTYRVNMFSTKEILTSLLQGIFITIGALFVYQFSIFNNYGIDTLRTMVFTVLIFANLFLTFVNRSFLHSIFTTFKYKNNLIPLVTVITIFIYLSMVYIPLFATFFEFKALNILQVVIAILVAFISVIWYETVKWYRRVQRKQKT